MTKFKEATKINRYDFKINEKLEKLQNRYAGNNSLIYNFRKVKYFFFKEILDLEEDKFRSIEEYLQYEIDIACESFKNEIDNINQKLQREVDTFLIKLVVETLRLIDSFKNLFLKKIRK
jgi:hypothetical protein